LAGEDAAMAAFRAAGPSRRRRRRTIRLATGATALVAAMAVTGGVAAAYPTTLPEPVQNAIHTVLGPIGVPAGPRAIAREHRLAAERRLRAAVHRRRQAAAAHPSPSAPAAVVPTRPHSPGAVLQPRHTPSPTPSVAPSA
jgi:hypothetical protein